MQFYQLWHVGTKHLVQPSILTIKIYVVLNRVAIHSRQKLKVMCCTITIHLEIVSQKLKSLEIILSCLLGRLFRNHKNHANIKIVFLNVTTDRKYYILNLDCF